MHDADLDPIRDHARYPELLMQVEQIGASTVTA
jgi:hypothetical protein